MNRTSDVKSDEAMARLADDATTDAEAEAIVADMAAGDAGLRAKDRSRAIATARDWLDDYDRLDLLDPAELAVHIGYGKFHVENLINKLEGRS